MNNNGELRIRKLDLGHGLNDLHVPAGNDFIKGRDRESGNYHLLLLQESPEPEELVSSDENYIISTRSVGKGGEGFLFKGKYKDQDIALKIAKPSILNDRDDDDEERFLNEAVAIQNLKERYPDLLIPKIYDFTLITIDEVRVPVLVMEWIEGQKLEYVHFDKKDECLKVFSKLGDTIDILHSHNLFHGDVKDSNIIIKENGDPILLDFGFSSWSSKEDYIRGVSYAFAPLRIANKVSNSEQVKWTVKDEIYSFAVNLYKGLTNGYPVVHEDHNNEEAYTPISRQIRDLYLSSDISTEEVNKLDDIFVDVFLNAQHKYNSCKELMDDVKKALGR